jgi:hypothetical protein
MKDRPALTLAVIEGLKAQGLNQFSKQFGKGLVKA